MKYFTSDLHLGHEKAINFQDKAGHKLDSWADLCYDIINSRVKKGDALYILGDFCVGKHKELAKYRNKIKLKDVWLISGNHQPKDYICKNVFGDKFRETYECKIKGASTWLSHYPHLAWPKSHYGSFHLFGHMHRQRSDYWDGIFPEMRALDVCPESYKHIFGDWGIFSEDQIYDFMMKRNGHDDINWYKSQRGEI